MREVVRESIDTAFESASAQLRDHSVGPALFGAKLKNDVV